MRNKINKIDIMGVKIFVTSKPQLLKKIEKKLDSSTKFSILTPNPELVLMAQKNIELKKALNSATFAIPDGIGLAQAARFLSFKGNDIISTFLQGFFVGLMTLINKKYLINYLPITKGRELFLDLIKLANKKKLKVFLLGGLDDEASIASSKLKIKYQKLKIATVGGVDISPSLSKDIVDKINKFSPDLLFVAFSNPYQEIFIMQNAKKLNAKCMMAVGGAFRYIAGYSKLPPKMFSVFGFEWLWRLITEPYRFRRILNAFPIFPIKVWLWKLIN